MKLYDIDEEYIEYLRKFDATIMQNKNNRKYVGIVLKINKIYYFAPLESGKREHEALLSSIYKVFVKYNDKILAIVGINNMIPVFDKTLVKKVDFKDYFNSSDINLKKYGGLLKKEISVLSKDEIKNEIERKAKIVYKQFKNNYKATTTNFKLIEEVAKKYEKIEDKKSSPLGTTFKL